MIILYCKIINKHRPKRYNSNVTTNDFIISSNKYLGCPERVDLSEFSFFETQDIQPHRFKIVSQSKSLI